MEIVRLLEGLGARVEAQSRACTDATVDAVLDIELDKKRTRLALELRRRAPYPGELQSLTELHERLETIGTPVLVAPYVSATTGQALSDAHWSWADGEGNADIRAPGIRIQRRVSNSPPPRRGSRLPSGAGAWAIIRALIVEGVAQGATAVARSCGVSQPRASQVLGRLTEAGFLDREGRSSWIADRPALLDAFLDQYAGPGGSRSWFYSLDPPSRVAEQAIAAAEPAFDTAISGDVAADLLAPWRTPTSVTVYISEPLPTSELGLVTADGPDDGNVSVTVPEDTSIFRGARVAGMPLAHPTQVIWDLMHLGGTDRLEAADRVRSWLLSR